MDPSVWDRAMQMQAAGKADDAIAMVRVQQRLRPRQPRAGSATRQTPARQQARERSRMAKAVYVLSTAYQRAA